MVVVRFAPSPTGPLHVGGVRTALYNYLFAKREGGKFILRIEDTDQTRFVEGAEAYIRECLQWCGITVDEGVAEGGPHAPYRQSERGALYQQYARQLILEGKAYYAFDTPEELEQQHKQAEAAGEKGWQYGVNSRMQLRNSLTLSEAETQQLLDAGKYVIRLKVPAQEEIHFVDEIRGEVIVQSATIDDKVLMKSDGLPTYHLANIVDDHLMEVTHVIRGEEWLPSAPLHILLYRAFGWQPPKFAHLPLILKPDGKGKLSKRDGDRLGIPVFALDWHDKNTGETASGFREAGFLPDALVNFLALQGWNPGTEEEVMSMGRMAELFSIERIGKAGTKFDVDKLRWFNQTYIKHKAATDLLPWVRQQIEKQGIAGDFTDEYLCGVIELLKERVTVMPDFVGNALYLYKPDFAYDEKFLAKQGHEEGKRNLALLKSVWEGIGETDWTADNLQHSLHQFLEGSQIPNGKILPQIRLALTGVSGGPDNVAIALLLGKTETLRRFERLLAH